ncbi:hypothetical protein F0562_019742 [Nyssa sinensis]|uniref:Cytochrome P450 n=1 Tax=Nyssa sinensis TaxID=561372 RepID=A0A5J5BNY3_9ASTE|nr:hypothetical protein F0562_019742 [Nyssa sinensis]
MTLCSLVGPKSKLPIIYPMVLRTWLSPKYGPYWRNVRKFCTRELLSTAKIDSFKVMRRDELESLVQSLMEAAKAHEVVDVSEKVAGLIEDMTYRMLFGRNKDDRFDLKSIVHQFLSLMAVPNLADYVPFLGAFDLQESLRLHPVAPLLLPHESMEDIVIGEYYIPKKSRIIVNCWALGRDSEVWSKNVEEFLPEMFKESDIDLRGRDFQLIPFRSGRRGCPGMHLGLLNIRLVVAQLVHCFHWELPNGMSTAEMDMTEKFDLSSPRAKHLLAMPKYCLGI